MSSFGAHCGITVCAADSRQGSALIVCHVFLFSHYLYMDGNIALHYKTNPSFQSLKLFQISGYCLKVCFGFWKKLFLVFVDPVASERLALPSLIKMP